MYDVIGDIHGHYSEMRALLLKMGYIWDEAARNFTAPGGRKAVFIGDYIDRGPDNLATVACVRAMVEAGQALALMGNHEFNAVLWATERPGAPGEYLRPHNEKHRRQHKKFLAEVEGKPDLYQDIIAWFTTLPLYLEIDGHAFVHACWYPPAIAQLRESGCVDMQGRLTEKGWIAAGHEGTGDHAAIEILLKGPEEVLGQGFTYADTEGTVRDKARLAWWRDKASTFGEAYASLPPSATFADATYAAAQSGTLSEKIREGLKSRGKGQIFIGHIWESGEPKPLSDQVICVDYSIARGDKMAAYRIDPSDPTPKPGNFVWVPYGGKT